MRAKFKMVLYNEGKRDAGYIFEPADPYAYPSVVFSEMDQLTLREIKRRLRHLGDLVAAEERRLAALDAKVEK